MNMPHLAIVYLLEAYFGRVHPHTSDPRDLEALRFLEEHGLATIGHADETEEFYLNVTPKGSYHTKALCGLPLPVQVWVTPSV